MDTGAAALVKVGWLWFDDDPKTSLEDKVSQAAGRYREKFGRSPKICYVNQRALAVAQTDCGPLQLRSASNVLPGHFLFVVDQAETAH